MEIVTPGQVIQSGEGFLRGHGTYVAHGKLIASVAGVVQRVNKLVSVVPLKSTYSGQVGDVVVGRVTEVGQKRWQIDVGSTQGAVLMLSSVNLPGGVQRRRTYEDQLNMRTLYAEGDLVSAEIHSFWADGAMSIHTRSRKYGKLTFGVLVQVPAVLMRRMKEHFHRIDEIGVDMLLASNGYVWLSPTPPEGERGEEEGGGDKEGEGEEATETAPWGGYKGAVDAGPEVRARMARVQQSIRVLAAQWLEVSPEAIRDVYEESEEKEVEVAAMLEDAVRSEVTTRACQRRDAQARSKPDV